MYLSYVFLSILVLFLVTEDSLSSDTFPYDTFLRIQGEFEEGTARQAGEKRREGDEVHGEVRVALGYWDDDGERAVKNQPENRASLKY